MARFHNTTMRLTNNSIAHIGLFALRCRLAYRSEFWKRPWSFPNGQLTLEFSIKFYKEPLRPRDRGDDAA